MIIKMTVRDNDFSQVLETYLNGLFLNISADLDYDARVDTFLNYMKEEKSVMSLLNPNTTPETYEEKDLDLIKERIKKSFEAYAQKRYPNSVDYLMSKLEVEILFTFEDKWENGESVYWLQNSGTVVNQ